MLKSIGLIGLAFTFAAGAVFADGHEGQCPLEYDVFEMSVPHTDMEECPASLEAGEDAFCRVSVVAEVATVFVFSADSNCLTSAKSFEEGEFTMTIN